MCNLQTVLKLNTCQSHLLYLTFRLPHSTKITQSRQFN